MYLFVAHAASMFVLVASRVRTGLVRRVSQSIQLPILLAHDANASVPRLHGYVEIVRLLAMVRFVSCVRQQNL